MTERKNKSWVAPLPASSKQGVATHRYSIAGRTRAETTRTPGTAMAGAATADDGLGMVSDALRARMVERIRTAGVKDPRVLDAMRTIARHLFVEPGLASRAYEDTALPIGHGQTISQPFIVARMIEIACAGAAPERVLEIGTGCGYQAAVLGRVARMVYSIERIKALHDLAKENLRPLRMANVRLHFGDGMIGLPKEAPFDVIILAAAGLGVPEALLEQLRIGGRLIAPVGGAGQAQHLVLVERTGARAWKEQRLDGVHFVPLLPGTI
jgi:protein-L-isoaspartate(D-aspartate) O-methyltransferase